MRSPRWITAALVLLLGAATAIYSAPLGDLAGTVRDARSGRPIAGAAVSLLDRSVTTNAEGRFELQGVPVGTFRLRAEAEGYRLGSERVLISAGRVGEVLILLEPVAQAPAHQLEAVEVTAPSVSGSNRAPTSYHYRDRLDVQNEVGAGWDLQRALTSVPGVTTTSDRTNLLVVRGGSPAENQLLIDHIEVPTLSHLSWQGETGGAIALLNLDFLRDAQFYTGAFPARYGGKLSSVLDVRFREGSRERFGGEIEASMAGFGGGFEGPLRRGRGSWILSYRKGFLDPLSDKLRFEEGLDSIRFQDAHGKLVYDLSPSQQISVTALGGSDGIHIRWVRNADRAEFSSAKFAGGVTWTHSIGAVGRLRATLSHTLNDYDVQVWQKEPEPVYVNRSVERETTLEAVADLGRSEKSAWWLGVSVRRTDFHHRIRSENWQGFSENQGRLVWLPKQRIDAHPAGYRWNSFVHRDQSLGERLILRLGLRASYWTLTGARSLDPRLQLDWRPTERTRLSAAFGTVHQAPTYLELTLDPANLSLDDSRAVHWLVGVEHRLSEGTRAQLEVYRKDYDRVPVLRDADQVAPEGVLLNTGEKLVRGVDLLLEHARPSGLTLAATASFSKALARDHLGGWFPDDFDYRRIAAVSVRVPTVAGVFAGLRWRYVGGRPFTLFPVERLPDGTYRPVPSAEGRNRLRYPAYRRLDLRLDRRFDFGGWGLSLFLEVQNLTNRENVFSRQFNKRTGEFKDLKEFPRMTLLGIIGDF